MELYVQKSLSSAFSLCRFLTVGTWIKPYPSSALSNLGGSCSELAYRRSGWFLTVSATSFGCYLFEENRRKCALILAGGQPASGRRSEGCWYGGCCRLLAGDLRGERQVFSNRICQSVWPWSHLNEPNWGQYGAVRRRLTVNMGVWRQTKETELEVFGGNVRAKDTGEKQYTAM